MSKRVKNLIVDSYQRRFRELDGAVMIDLRGIAANDNNALRATLAEKQVRITVVKNGLAERAWVNTPMAGLVDLLEGSCAIAYGESVINVARDLIEQADQVKFKFKGALLDGQVFGPNEVKALSKYPTREEAQAQIIQVALGPAAQVIGAAVGAGSQIASIVKTIEEKLEKGETINRAGQV